MSKSNRDPPIVLGSGSARSMDSFRCPFCQSNEPPLHTTRSGPAYFAGVIAVVALAAILGFAWSPVALLLLLLLPVCWGLQERVTLCRACRTKLG